MTLIPVYLTSSIDNEPVDSLTFAPVEVQVSVDGAELADAAGTLVEVGGTGLGKGAYVYAPTAAEEAGKTLLLVVTVTDVSPYNLLTRFPIVDIEMNVGETDEDKRRVVFRSTDAAGNPLLSLDSSEVDFGQLTVSINGGAFADALGEWSEIGAGDYSLIMDPAEIVFGLVIVHAECGSCSTLPFLYAFYVGPRVPVAPTPPVPIPVPIVYGDPDYVDLVKIGIDHLPQQFKQKGSG